MQIGIRHCECSDVGTLRRLICTTIDANYAMVYPPRAVAFFKDFHTERRIIVRHRTGTVLVVERDGEMVATGSLVDGEIFALFVHPGHQGAGLGRALMDALEDRARASGITESVLSVSIPSRTFYERLGYEIVETRSRDVGEGQSLDFWKARKLLVPPG